MQDGEHAEQDDEPPTCLLGRAGGSFSFGIVVDGRLVLILLRGPEIVLIAVVWDLQPFHDLEHLDDGLPRVAQASYRLQTRLASSHGNQHVDQVPPDLLGKLGILQNAVERGQDVGRHELFHDGQVGEAVGGRGPRLGESLNGLGSVGHTSRTKRSEAKRGNAFLLLGIRERPLRGQRFVTSQQ